MTASLTSDNIVPDRNLEHWVCFTCRKMFKRPLLRENDGVSPISPVIAHKCPECKDAMINMGPYFEPPRQQNWAAWEKMKLLAEYGHFFFTAGCKAYIEKFIVGKPPISVRNLRKLLEQNEKSNRQDLAQRHHHYLQELKREKARLRRMK